MIGIELSPKEDQTVVRSNHTTHTQRGTTMSNGLMNVKKMINKKRPTKLPIMKETNVIHSKAFLDNIEKMKAQKRTKNAEKRKQDIKKYRRSLDRIWIAKYIQEREGIHFMEICSGLEGKSADIIKLVAKYKNKLVEERFGAEEGEEEEEVEEEE